MQHGKQITIFVLFVIGILFAASPIAAGCTGLTIESPQAPYHWNQTLVVTGTASGTAHFEFISESTFTSLQGPGTDYTYPINITDRGDTIRIVCSDWNGSAYTGADDRAWVYIGGATEAESNLALGLIFAIIAFSAILMYAAINYGKRGDREDEDDADSHAPLRIFLFLFSIISLVVALNLGAGFEATYLTSPDGDVYSGFSGMGGYALIFVTIAYFLIYIIYRMLNYVSPKNMMSRRRGDG